MIEPKDGEGRTSFVEDSLGNLFEQSHDRGRPGLLIMSLSMDRGLVPRNQDERRVETHLSDEQHRLVRAGELTYNMMRMWQGVCSLAEEDCLVSPAYVVLRPKEGMDPKYSEYLLTFEDTIAEFRRLSFGVVDDRLRLYYKDFERVRVEVPSPAHQRKVALILTTLDNLIEKTEALIAKYQAVKQGMMIEVFQRGIERPFRLRPPHSENPLAYHHTDLGWIPRSWKVDCVANQCTLRSGGTPNRDQHERYFKDGQIPWVKTMDLTEHDILTTDEMITDVALRETACSVLPVDTVLVAMYGGFMQIGRTGILGVEAATNQAVCGLSCRSSDLHPRFLMRCLQFLRGRWRSVATSTRKDPNITKSDIGRFLVAIPPEDEQQWICSVVDQVDDLLRSEHVRLAKISELRRGLLQSLLTGKVRVKVDDAEEVGTDA